MNRPQLQVDLHEDGPTKRNLIKIEALKRGMKMHNFVLTAIEEFAPSLKGKLVRKESK